MRAKQTHACRRNARECEEVRVDEQVSEWISEYEVNAGDARNGISSAHKFPSFWCYQLLNLYASTYIILSHVSSTVWNENAISKVILKYFNTWAYRSFVRLFCSLSPCHMYLSGRLFKEKRNETRQTKREIILSSCWAHRFIRTLYLHRIEWLQLNAHRHIHPDRPTKASRLAGTRASIPCVASVWYQNSNCFFFFTRFRSGSRSLPFIPSIFLVLSLAC